MTIPVLQVRRSRLAVLLATLAAATVGIAIGNYFFFSRPDSIVWRIHEATSGWINGNLPMFTVLNLIVLAGIICGWGRHRLAELGLGRNWLAQIIGWFAVGWIVLQSLALLSVLATGGDLELNRVWTEYGTGTVVGMILAMLLGTALFEEAVFRGYLLPQLAVRLGRGRQASGLHMAGALVLGTVIFALWHIPTILLNRDGGVAEAAGALAFMAFGAIMLSLVFLRTGSLAIAIATHALVNAPYLLVASPVPAAVLAGAVGLATTAAGPLLAGRRWSAQVLRVEAHD